MDHFVEHGRIRYVGLDAIDRLQHGAVAPDVEHRTSGTHDFDLDANTERRTGGEHESGGRALDLVAYGEHHKQENDNKHDCDPDATDSDQAERDGAC